MAQQWTLNLLRRYYGYWWKINYRRKDFSALKTKIEKFEADLGQMRSNLNAIYGAIQQCDKLMKMGKEKQDEKV